MGTCEGANSSLTTRGASKSVKSLTSSLIIFYDIHLYKHPKQRLRKLYESRCSSDGAICFESIVIFWKGSIITCILRTRCLKSERFDLHLNDLCLTKGCESRESTGKVPRTKLELPHQFPPTTSINAATTTLTITTTATATIISNTTTISITTPCVHRDFLQLFMEL